MTKKILIFSLAYFPKHVGGAEIAIKEITDRISSEEIEFDMIALRFDSSLPLFERIGNVNVYRIGYAKPDPTFEELVRFPMYLVKVLYPFSAALKALSLHRRSRYDGAWAMMSYMGFPIILLRFFLCTRIPYVLTLQEGDTVEHVFKRMRIRMVSLLYIPVYRSASVITTISHYLAGWARSMGYKGLVEVVPNAVDAKRFAHVYAQAEIDEIKHKLNKKLNDVFLITTSRLVTKNACDDVIRALVHLPANFHFIILGVGPDEAMLKALVKELELERRVQFLGQIGQSDMPKYLRASDIFIRPSLSEGFGISFVEAMAADLPVIATQEGGIADFLFDRERNPDKPSTGWAVNARDPEGIARQVKRIIENPDERKETMTNAKKMVFAEYDWGKIAGDMKTKGFDSLFS